MTYTNDMRFTLPEIYALLQVLDALPAHFSFDGDSVQPEAVSAAHAALVDRGVLLAGMGKTALAPAFSDLITPAVFPEVLCVITIATPGQSDPSGSQVYLSAAGELGTVHQVVAPGVYRFERCAPASQPAWIRTYIAAHYPAAGAIEVGQAAAGAAEPERAMRHASQIGALLVARPAEGPGSAAALGWFVSGGRPWLLSRTEAEAPTPVELDDLLNAVTLAAEQGLAAAATGERD